MTDSTKANDSSINIFANLKTKISKEPVVLPVERQKKLSTLDTKSKMIRYLAKEGYQKSQIASILGIRYQFVNNVLNQVVKN